MGAECHKIKSQLLFPIEKRGLLYFAAGPLWYSGIFYNSLPFPSRRFTDRKSTSSALQTLRS